MSNSQNTTCYVNNWLVDTQSGSIIHQHSGEQKRLGEYQLKLLNALALHAGEVLTREQLTNLVWEGRVIGNNSLPNAVHALRIALEDDGKNQRIIKTIPKRGYLLEKEFCSCFQCVAEETNDGISQQQAEEPFIVAHDPADATLRQSQTVAILSKTRRPFSIMSFLLYGVFTLCLIGIGVFAYSYFGDESVIANSFAIKQISVPKLNNIDIYRVVRSSQQESSENDPDKIAERIEPALQQLDTRLNDKHSKMYVYYRASSSVLNYVFSLQTPCGKKELSMNIHHWRINNERLNKLILRETERKLNETTSCNN